MNRVYDVAVIGAGPAGLVAATVAARHALATALFDERAALGVEAYGGPIAGSIPRRGRDDADVQSAAVVDAFLQSGATPVLNATVWAARKRDDELYEIGVAYGAADARSVRLALARSLIIATGAVARPFPMRGGTLPGVLTGADACALSDIAAWEGKSIVLAGCGPMLWELAARLLDAGVRPEALLDTTPRGQRLRTFAGVWDRARAPDFLHAIALQRDVRRRVRVVPHVAGLEARGPGRLDSVEFDAAGGAHSLRAEVLLLHQGCVPDINLGSALGCAHRWNDARACFEPIVDAWGGSSLADVFFAGDAAGIAGTRVARAQGELAALAAANALGRIDSKARDATALRPRTELRRALRGRSTRDAMYLPADEYRIPRGDTIVCACEGVTAQQVQDALQLGAAGPNQVKAYTRCGMGACQGRGCGLTVTEMVARERRIAPDAAGYFRLRWPAKPITLRELASLPSSPEAERAVARGFPR